MPKSSYAKVSPAVYFIGIGGTGMSALAGILASIGIRVCGSDVADKPILKLLAKRQIEIFLSQNSLNIQKCNPIEFAVATTAIPKGNPELKALRKLNIPVLSYGQALGLVTRFFKTVGIAGTHGKTTTTSMVSQILLDSQSPFMALIGSGFTPFKGLNFHIPDQMPSTLKDQILSIKLKKAAYKPTVLLDELLQEPLNVTPYPLWFVIEADEYKYSFLNHRFEYLALVGIDYDHHDFYKTHEQYLNAFARAVVNTHKAVILNLKDPMHQKILKMAKTITKQQAGQNHNAPHIKNHLQKINHASAAISHPGLTFNSKGPSIINWSKNIQTVKHIKLWLPTEFMIQDAAVAYTVAQQLKIPKTAIKTALRNFRGAKRRFEILGRISLTQKNNPLVISDYAHNPKKVRYAILALKTYIEKRYDKKHPKILIIFQPHQYFRLYKLRKEFIKNITCAIHQLLSHSVRLWITDVFAARSPKSHRKLINSEKFARKLRIALSPAKIEVSYSKGLEHTRQKLLKTRADIVMLISAGDLPKILREL